MELCRKVMNGEEEAEKVLELDKVIVRMPKKPKISHSSLQQDFTIALTMATAANKLKRTLLESECLQNMYYIREMAALQKVELDTSTDVQDVAEVMLAILDETKSWLSPSATSTESAVSASTESALPPGPAVPVIPAVSASTESVPPPGPAVPVNPAVSASTESALPPGPALPAQPAMSPSTESTLPICPEVHGSEDGSADELNPKQEEASAVKKSPKELGYSGGRNKLRACPLCDFQGTHLARHIQSQHSDKCMSTKDVRRYVAISDEKLQLRGTVLATPRKPKGKDYLYQCGYKGCSSIVKRMGQHLKQAHQLKDKEKIKEAKTKFTRLDMPQKGKIGIERKPISTAKKPALKTKDKAESSLTAKM